MAKANNILETIGNTAELRINKLFDPRVEVWVKLERQNPGGSIKDRIALSMIEDAERRGVLRPGSIIVEPTSGNTGVGLALVAAVKGYKLILVMPESFSVERRKLMAAYGATFELTPRELGMKGAIAKAREIVAETPRRVAADAVRQPGEPGSPQAHHGRRDRPGLPRRPRLRLRRCRNGRARNGHRRGAPAALAAAAGLRRRARALTGAQRRQSRPASHPGHRRRFRPRQLPRRCRQRSHRGGGSGRLQRTRSGPLARKGC